MGKAVCVYKTFALSGKFMVLFQTVCHKNSLEFFIVLFRMITMPGFLVLIYNDLGIRAEFSGKMHPHVALAPCRPIIMDHFHRSLITLIYMCL